MSEQRGTTPSWATFPAPVEERARRAPGGRLVRVGLVLAAVVAASLALAEAVHVVGRDDLVPGMRAFLVLVVAVQVVLAVLAARRSSGAAFGLMVCELTTIVAAVGGGFGDVRGPFAAAAAAVIVLLVASLRAFPSPELPPIETGAT